MLRTNRASPVGGRLRVLLAGMLVAGLALVAGSCSAGEPRSGKKSIVVTYTVLGSVVSDLVGDRTQLTVLMPNGADLHEWSPSARDIEKLTHADLLVENGLNLEGGMGNAFDLAQRAGVRRFVASDHITVRKVGQGQGVDTSDPDQAVGAADPHLWMDPLAMKDVVISLATELQSGLGIDVSARAADLEARLSQLNEELATTLAVVPADQRRLVTGHESLGYFADRYGFELVGAIVPSLTTQAETSAAELADLEAKIRQQKVKAIFTEVGTSPAVADAVGSETGAKVVELTTHALPSDGSYFTFMKNIAQLVASNLS
jgi:zinc/manganese transport system substrate-binding protein